MAGHAAAQAEHEKRTAYPAAGGRAIWVIAQVTWGLLGAETGEMLEECAAIMGRQANRLGRVSGNHLRRRSAAHTPQRAPSS